MAFVAFVAVVFVALVGSCGSTYCYVAELFRCYFDLVAITVAMSLSFLGAPKHLYNCPLVGWSVTHSFDDPRGDPTSSAYLALMFLSWL